MCNTQVTIIEWNSSRELKASGNSVKLDRQALRIKDKSFGQALCRWNSLQGVKDGEDSKKAVRFNLLTWLTWFEILNDVFLLIVKSDLYKQVLWTWLLMAEYFISLDIRPLSATGCARESETQSSNFFVHFESAFQHNSILISILSN